MKKKNLNLKLQLNKETVAKLNNEQMNGVKGGGPTVTCGTCATECGGATCYESCAGGCATVTECMTKCLTPSLPVCMYC